MHKSSRQSSQLVQSQPYYRRRRFTVYFYGFYARRVRDYTMFDTVGLQKLPLTEQIKRFKLQIAENLETLIIDGEISPDWSVDTLIHFLKSNVAQTTQ